ncbi:adenine phosphoribosyltransferase [Aricia agestis]|uniref:adenine phosphoribosyltransferase n=1 Tax=Aricia agestis TaxID=91739 RepID=UPI001C2025F8|nr:adenine phosphoribosyltransferase [Aricia agestis]
MNEEYHRKVSEFKKKLKSYENYPKPGILFWDIFAALSDGPTCKLLQSIIMEVVKTKFPDVQAVIGLESRGFLFSFSLAAELGIGCIPARKKGKLPGEVISYKYDLEYGSDILEIQKDVIRPGLKCLIVDDLIATGGSITAAAKLLQSCGAQVVGCLVVMEIEAIKGKDNIPENIPVHSLIQL